jgi:hypothetical protein
MEFTVVQRFSCAPEVYWARSRGAEFEAAVAKEAEVQVETLPPRGAVERTRVTQLAPLPAMAQKAMGVERFRYVQEVESDEPRFATKWSIVPDVMTDRVTCRGESHVRAAAGGCERVIRGTIEVRLPLVGGAIEKHIAEQIQRGYTRAEPVIRRFVEGP